MERVLLPFDPEFELDPEKAPIKPAWLLDSAGMVYLRCLCGVVLGGPLRHSIGADGEVNASVLHTGGGGAGAALSGKCGWHVFCRLEGWVDGELKADVAKFAPRKHASRPAHGFLP